jgi:hypothetical protein
MKPQMLLIPTAFLISMLGFIGWLKRLACLLIRGQLSKLRLSVPSHRSAYDDSFLYGKTYE